MLLGTIRFTFIRMLRGLIGHLLLIGVPIAVISILSMVAGYIESGEDSISGMRWISVSMVVSFQMFGGSYTMSFIQEDLFSAKKWRMYSLPFPAHKYVNVLLVVSTLFSMLQGLVIVLFTQWVYGVDWGNIVWLMVVLFSLSLLSQIVCMILALAVTHFKLAERLSEVYGIGSMLLAGVMFPLPDTAFFNFMTEFGTPVSLGRTAIFGMASGDGWIDSVISVAVLLAASALLLLLAARLGRKKLG